MHERITYMGLDVHDVGDYKVADNWRMLERGMVTTIEPGIYIAADAKGVPKRWRGIGIRLEDDVHVGRDGPEVLSEGLALAADDVERLMSEAA